MTHSFKKKPGSMIDLEVTLSPEEFHEYWQTEYEAVLRKVELKGFRPGTAPKELSDRAIDKEKVFEKAANQAVRFSLNEISQDNNWNIIDQPKIEITEANSLMSDTGQEIGNKGDATVGLKYKAELAIFPGINLGNYKKIAEKVLKEKKEITVEPQEIEKTLGWLRQSRAKLTRASHETRKGNLIEADIESFADEKPLPGGKIKDDRFVLGESRYLPGFDDNLLNRTEGENLNFSVTAPADYWQRELRNKKIDFRVKLKAIFDRDLPELNDDFARCLGGNFSDLENLRKSVNDGLKIEKENKEKERLRAKMLEEIVKSARADIPQIMTDKMLEKMVSEVKQLAASGGGNTLPGDDELKEKLKDKARKQILGTLALNKIAEAEKIEPLAEEIKQEARALNLYPEQGQGIDSNGNYDYAYMAARNKKIFNFLEKLSPE